MREKPYLAWPDNTCGVGDTCFWGSFDPDLMRQILARIPDAWFTPTFLPKRHPRYHGLEADANPRLWEWEFEIRTERVGDISGGVPTYKSQRAFYLNVKETDIDIVREMFDVGPRGGPCDLRRPGPQPLSEPTSDGHWYTLVERQLAEAHENHSFRPQRVQRAVTCR